MPRPKRHGFQLGWLAPGGAGRELSRWRRPASWKERGMNSRVVMRSVALLSVLLLFPAIALAQAAITGVVKDVSGAVAEWLTKTFKAIK